ncbi:MAG: WXG100 family type VII secretion target [Deinococcales bacterium]
MAKLYTDTETLRSLANTFQDLSQEMQVAQSHLNDAVEAMVNFWQDETYDRFQPKAQEHLQKLSQASRVMMEMSEIFVRQRQATEIYLED